MVACVTKMLTYAKGTIAYCKTVSKREFGKHDSEVRSLHAARANLRSISRLIAP